MATLSTLAAGGNLHGVRVDRELEACEKTHAEQSVDAGAAKKLPVSAYYDNRYVDELEKEGFFKKLWQ